MKKQQLINEIMGVPKAVDFWVENFSIILTGMAKGLLDKDEIEETEVEYENEEGEVVEDKSYRIRAKMTGKEFMSWVLKIGGYSDLKELINDPRFQQFPLYNPTVNLSLYFLPKEVMDKEMQGRTDIPDFIEASHGFDVTKKTMSKIGKQELFVNQSFGFQVYLTNDELNHLNLEGLRKKLKPTISHELTHAYEGYNRFKSTGHPFHGRETFLNAAVKLMSDDKYPQWRSFLNLVYLHLSFEINARVTQFYYELKDKDVKTTEEFLTLLKKSTVWRELQMLENFNTDEFIKSFKMRGLDFFELMADIGKQMEREREGLPAIKPRKTSTQSMQHLIQGWDYVLQTLNQQLSRQGVYKGKLMDLVPQKAMNDPYYFFKFFEKRFHKKAAKFKKKLYNIGTLAMDKSLMEKE